MMRETEIMSNPHAREITENLRRLHAPEASKVCPACGDVDHGNRMNGKSFCFKCGVPLVSRDKLDKWVKPPKMRKAPVRFDEPEGVLRYRRRVI